MKTLRIRMLIFFSKMRHFGNIENKIIKTISDPHVPNKFLTFFVLKNKKKKKVLTNNNQTNPTTFS